MSHRKRNRSSTVVVLIVDMSRDFDRQFVRGIARFTRLHEPWIFTFVPDSVTPLPSPKTLREASGVIARFFPPTVARAVCAAKVPTIAIETEYKSFHGMSSPPTVSRVITDTDGAAHLAAMHFVQRSFQHLAFVGDLDRVSTNSLGEVFQKSIRELAGSILFHKCPDESLAATRPTQIDSIGRWIKSLPKPLGIFAGCDKFGFDVLEACRHSNISVPNEVAVIGVGNDKLICELADPSLSSISFNAEAAGYRAAGLLDQMMRAKEALSQQLIVEPSQIVCRSSTDVTATAPREVLAALTVIKRRATKRLSVDDIVEATGVSRRRLEVQFRDHVGRSLLDEVLRFRLQHAKSMLMETELPIAEVAAACGYNSVSYMTQMFGRAMGITPVRFRELSRVEPSDDRMHSSTIGSTNDSFVF